MAVQVRGVQHVVHAGAGQVLTHSSICPGNSEAQQLALPCCDGSVQVLQVGVLTLLYLPCSRWPLSALLQGQACWGAQPVHALQVERLALPHPRGRIWLVSALLKEQVQRAIHLLQVGLLPMLHLLQEMAAVRADTGCVEARLKGLVGRR